MRISQKGGWPLALACTLSSGDRLLLRDSGKHLPRRKRGGEPLSQSGVEGYRAQGNGDPISRTASEWASGEVSLELQVWDEGPGKLREPHESV